MRIIFIVLLATLSGCCGINRKPYDIRDPWGRTFEEVIHENLRLQEELNSIYNKETKEENNESKATETIRPIEA